MNLPAVRRSPNLTRTLELDALAETVRAREGWVELARFDAARCGSTQARKRFQALDARGIDIAVRTDPDAGVRVVYGCAVTA